MRERGLHHPALQSGQPWARAEVDAHAAVDGTFASDHFATPVASPRPVGYVTDTPPLAVDPDVGDWTERPEWNVAPQTPISEYSDFCNDATQAPEPLQQGAAARGTGGCS